MVLFSLGRTLFFYWRKMRHNFPLCFISDKIKEKSEYSEKIGNFSLKKYKAQNVLKLKGKYLLKCCPE